MNKRTIGQAVACSILSLWLLTACSGQSDPVRAERPEATSTPAKPGQGVMAAPAPLSPLLKTATPLTHSEDVPLTTEEQLAMVVVPTRDLRELAMRLDPSVGEIPIVVSESAADYQVGDEIAFWVHDLDNNDNFEISAELVHKTDVAYIWVESGRDYDHDEIVASTDRFSQGSYPDEVDFFGNAWNPGVDNDPRLHILHAADLGSGIAGYYSSADQYSRLANPFSNEKEMFYINLSWLNSARNYEYYETVLAHEFQHMVHWYKDRNEETWLNEGLSEFAQEVAGYEPDTEFARTFASVPDTQLNTWGDSTAGNAEHYGSAYLFVAYFAQRFGPEMTRALVAHPANGVASFDAVLAEAGYEQRFADVFADWVVANYVDDPNALGEDGVYGYHLFEQAAPKVETLLESYPTEPFTATVSNYGTDYVLLKGEGDVEVEFRGQTATGLAGTEAHSGDFAWWSNRGEDSDARLSRQFDLRSVESGSPLFLEAALWWDIEHDYDYGYVLASRDGVSWDILPGQRTSTDDPTGNSFGPAYSGRSSDEEDGDTSAWVTERYDLSNYAGDEVWIRFEYVTDDAVNASGWFVDDVRIPAIDYASDFEQGDDGWISEGWLLTDNHLAQQWLVQVMELDDNRLQAVQRFAVGADGLARFNLDDLGGDRTAVLAISGMAPVTTEIAEYLLAIDLAE
jgi:immune inhibitor A